MASKLGPHVLSITPAALSWSHVARLVKCVDQIEPFEVALPSALRVFRHYLANQNLDDATGTVQAVLAALGGYRHPNLLVELWNECHPTLAQLKAAVDLLHAANLKVAAPSWGTGDFTQADWDIATAAKIDVYNVHAYWDPGKLDIWEAYRYRQFWKPGQAPVIVSECGRRLGWTPLNELQEYAAEISKDGYVLGATPFTCGPWQYPGVDPQAFNVDSIVPQLMTGGQPMPPTPPIPTFNVGAGILALMKSKGDAPKSDEHYKVDANGVTYGSEAYGNLGLYVWSKEANQSYFLGKS